MGTSQIIMVILSVVLVGIAVAFAVVVFHSHSVNTSRQLLVTDLDFLASQAIRFWRTPESMGGASHNIDESDQEALEFFLRWSGNTDATDSGIYTIKANADGTIEITGTGNEIGKDGINPVRATLILDPSSHEPLNIVIEN
ncbi:MAG: hypothetical protein K9N06_08275 [Candidatus Cloacimonetes bacterium]|nr:hypothetical protein [Candidatus Cloacimonadota bacterium]